MNKGNGAMPGIFKGHLCYMILRALQKKPLHGYAIIKRIELITGDIWKPTTGSVYPALEQMLGKGMISIKESAEKGRKRKVYRLTAKGTQELKDRKKSFEKIVKTADEMFQRLFPKEKNPAELMQLIGESRFLRKELIETKLNLLQAVILSKKGKISETQKQEIKSKLGELNRLVKKIIENSKNSLLIKNAD